MNCKLLFLVGVLICGYFFVVEAKKLKKPRNTCVHRTCVEIVGKSGKFKVYNRKRREKGPLTILFDEIAEIDKDGKTIGKTGGQENKHSFKSFASLEFNFTDIKNVTYKGIKAAMFTFSARIPGPNATLTVDMYFFYGNGTGDVCDAEEFPIHRGTVKFNIKIEGWNFCSKSNPCKKGNKEEIGEYIDFTITAQKKGKVKKGVKGKKGKGKKKMAQEFMLGTGENSTKIDFPSYIQLDGAKCTQMPDEYPKMTIGKGDKHSITFRFPRFANNVFYDPTIDDEAASASGGSSSGGGGESTTPGDIGPTGDGSGSLGSTPMVLAAILVLGRMLF